MSQSRGRYENTTTIDVFISAAVGKKWIACTDTKYRNVNESGNRSEINNW